MLLPCNFARHAQQPLQSASESLDRRCQAHRALRLPTQPHTARSIPLCSTSNFRYRGLRQDKANLGTIDGMGLLRPLTKQHHKSWYRPQIFSHCSRHHRYPSPLHPILPERCPSNSVATKHNNHGRSTLHCWPLPDASSYFAVLECCVWMLFRVVIRVAAQS